MRRAFVVDFGLKLARPAGEAQRSPARKAVTVVVAVTTIWFEGITSRRTVVVTPAFRQGVVSLISIRRLRR
jgi:hypothetical protein